MKTILFLFIASLAISVLAHQGTVQGQILDRILNTRNANSLDDVPGGGENRETEMRPIFKRIMNALSVNVPGVYDMTKDGNSMGINVLSGMVRVDRGREAERSGLQGPRPLSVRIFGVPVYERGIRLDNGRPNGNNPDVIITGDRGSTARPDEDEELPIES